MFIMLLALLIFGPSKLPDLATTLGKAIRQFRRVTQDLTNNLDIDDEVKQPFRELHAALRNDPAPYVPPRPAENIVPRVAPDAVPAHDVPQLANPNVIDHDETPGDRNPPGLPSVTSIPKPPSKA